MRGPAIDRLDIATARGRAERRPLLSPFIGARNDDYMGGFLWRLKTCLNYVGRSLDTLGRLDDVEHVVVDWGSAVPLRNVLALEAAARRLVRFVVVPAEVGSRETGRLRVTHRHGADMEGSPDAHHRPGVFRDTRSPGSVRRSVRV